MAIKTELLLDAARLIEAVIAGLDKSTTTCDACGRIASCNWPERKAFEELAGCRRKLQRLAETLNTGANGAQGEVDEDEIITRGDVHTTG